MAPTITLDNFADFDNGDESSYVYFLNVTTRELKKVPDPLANYWSTDYLQPGMLPDSTHKSAPSTVALLCRLLPGLTDAVRQYYNREKLEEQPAKGSWTIFFPMIGLSIRTVIQLLYHARQANGVLTAPLRMKLNATYKIAICAKKLSNCVDNSWGSNAEYLELYYEVLPKMLDILVVLQDEVYNAGETLG